MGGGAQLMWATLGWLALGIEVLLAAAGLAAGLVLVLRHQGGPWAWVVLLVAINFPWGVLLGWPQGWVLGSLPLSAASGAAAPGAIRGVEFFFGLLGNLPLFTAIALGLRTIFRPLAQAR